MIRKLNKRNLKKSLWNNCKGISEIIGYVLLIGGALTASTLVYAWLKTYVPQGTISECSEKASLFVKKADCTSETDITLKLTLKNNGLFDIDGYLITASTDPTKKIEDIDIASKSEDGTNGVILFNNGRAPLKPNQEASFIFNDIGDIKFIQIIPARFEIIKGRKRFTPCGESRITENIICSSPPPTP